MTIDLLALIAGALLSLAFSYIPGLKDKFGQFPPETKRLVMAGLLFGVALALFGLACANWLEALWPGMGVACTQAGALELVRIFALAAISNQSTFQLSKPSQKP